MTNWCKCGKPSCFPHIVNLACKAVLGAMTKLEYASQTAQDYVPTGPEPTSFWDAINRDSIATVRSLVRAVCDLLVMELVN